LVIQFTRPFHFYHLQFLILATPMIISTAIRRSNWSRVASNRSRMTVVTPHYRGGTRGAPTAIQRPRGARGEDNATVCETRPVRRQTYGCLPRGRASPLLGRCQTILPADGRNEITQKKSRGRIRTEFSERTAVRIEKTRVIIWSSLYRWIMIHDVSVVSPSDQLR